MLPGASTEITDATGGPGWTIVVLYEGEFSSNNFLRGAPTGRPWLAGEGGEQGSNIENAPKNHGDVTIGAAHATVCCPGAVAGDRVRTGTW